MNSIVVDQHQEILNAGVNSQTNYLQLIERKMHRFLGDVQGTMRKMCLHIATSGGKRVRPLLVLNSGLIFSEVTNDLINTAVAAELIHMASLVHDDIIDKSELRRNKPSVNKLWGNQYGVLCGDYLYAKAFNILSKSSSSSSCLRIMVEAIENMCDGEIIQAENRFNSNMTSEIYYSQISKKTASLLASCCSCGAIIGGADDSHIGSMYEYGINIGLAYQIIDDILDFCGDSKIMGKPQGEDLRQGIITLPVLLLLNQTTCQQDVRNILNKDQYTDQDIETINRYLIDYGAIEEAYKIAYAHIDTAKSLVDRFPSSPYKQFLLAHADKLKTRKS